MARIPIGDAIYAACFAASGKDGWDELKREMLHGRVPTTCRVNGQVTTLQPAWLDYIVPFGEHVPPTVTPDYLHSRESKLPQESDHFRKVPTAEALGTHLSPIDIRPVPTTDAPTDGALWFDHRPGCPVGMPRVVMDIEVDGEAVARLWPAVEAVEPEDGDSPPDASDHLVAYRVRVEEAIARTNRPPPIQDTKTGEQGDREWAVERGISRKVITEWRRTVVGKQKAGRPRNPAENSAEE